VRKSHAHLIWREAREVGLDVPTRFPRRHPLNSYQLSDIFYDTNPLKEALRTSPRIYKKDLCRELGKEQALRQAMETRAWLDREAKEIIEKIKNERKTKTTENVYKKRRNK